MKKKIIYYKKNIYKCYMNNTLSLINNKIQHSLFLLDNDYFRVAIIMALVLYCSLVVTVIPRNIANLFNNMVFCVEYSIL